MIDNLRDNYKMGKELGHGSFGCVNLAKQKQTDKKVAIKVIKKRILEESPIYMELLRNELLVLEETDHPHITRVFELMEDKKNFYVVMELLPEGNLLDKICEMTYFTEDHAVMILHQIMLALNYLHQKNITHRDLKPENVMC